MIDANPTVGTWPELAACRGKPTAWFFPPGDRAYDRARAICATCEVQAPCLARAMRAEGRQSAAVRHGMYGGLTPAERDRIVRRARARAR